MAEPPETIPGLRLDERFFASVIRRAGGCRLKDVCSPLEGVLNADFLLRNWAVELKNLVDNPLQKVERQKKIADFVRAEFPNPIWVTPMRRAIKLDKRQEEIYWVNIMGGAIQRAMRDADAQIRDTQSYLRNQSLGLVLMVNNAVDVWGWSGFVNLIATYMERCPHVDGVIAMEALPEPANAVIDHALHIAIGSRPLKPVPDEIIGLITRAIKDEVFHRTGRSPSLRVRGDLGADRPIAFEFGPDGMFRMKG